jgi:hypothetical protein
MTLDFEQGDSMFSACANPDCKKKFDYREGRFFRFHKSCLAGDSPPNTHCVQHLWLCGKCSEHYTLAYEGARGVVMTLHRMDLPGERDICRFVAVA